MALGSIVSRLTGFLRTAAIGAAIGAGLVANDYNIAYTLPSMVYELLLGGILSSVIVPLLVRARRHDADRGEAYTQRLLSLAVICLGAATVVVVTAAPLLTALMTDDRTHEADRDLITLLARLLLPVIFFYGLAALFAAILNTRGHFAAPMWTPILNNAVVILTAVVFMLLPTAGNRLTAESITLAQVLVLGVGTSLGIVVQASGLVPALRRVGFRWRWRFDFRKLQLRELGRTASWMLLYVAVSQVGVIVVIKIAQMAAGRGGPGPAIFNNAFLIFMMAHGIVAVSVMTALMPRMSAAAADGRHADLAAQLSQGTRLAAVILIPAATLYVVLGRPLAVTLFAWGEYELSEARQTGWAVAVAGLALVPFALSQLQTSALYALRDTRTPALVNIPVVALRLALDVVFYVVLPATWVVASLMGGTAVSFALALVLGYWLLRRRIGRLGLGRVANTLGRLALAAVIAAVPAGLAAWGISAGLGDAKLGSFVQLLVGGTLLAGGYYGAAMALRVAEVRELTSMVRGRLGR